MNDPRHGHGQPVVGGHHPQQQQHPQQGQRPAAGIVSMQPKPVVPATLDLEPIGLDDDVPAAGAAALKSDDPLVANAAGLRAGPMKIQAFGVSMGGPHAEHQWKRAPVNTGKGICRVKSFHGRLSDQGMDFLDNTINEWLDAHPEVDVKNVTTVTNMFDGKTKELALVVNIWY